jgi:hypothetical protein
MRYRIGPTLRRLSTVTLPDSAPLSVTDQREQSMSGSDHKAVIGRLTDKNYPA